MNRHSAPIDPRRIAFDIDGVVADTMSLFIDIARDEFAITGIKMEDITRYNLDECLSLDEEVILKIIDKLLTGEYRAPLKPLSGARKVLSRLSGYQEKLLFVTARPVPGPIPQWMAETLQMSPAAFEIIFTGAFEAKAEALRERGVKFFVEDRLETCFALQDAGILPVLFKQPWNREPHPFHEVGSWPELEKLIAFDGKKDR